MQMQQQRRPHAAVDCDYSSLPQQDDSYAPARDESSTGKRNADSATATIATAAAGLLRRRLSLACLLSLMTVSAIALAMYIGYRAAETSSTARSNHEPHWWSALAAGDAAGELRANASSAGRHAAALLSARTAAVVAASASVSTANADSASVARSSWCYPCECLCDAGPYIYQWHCGGRAADGVDVLGEGIGGRLHHVKIAATVARMTNFTLILHPDCLRDGHHHEDLDTRLGIGRSADCDSCSLSSRDIVYLANYQTKQQLVLNTTRHTTCPVLSTADKAALLHDDRAAINSSWFAPALLTSLYRAIADMNSSSLSRAVFGFNRHPVVRPLGACTADLFHSRYETRYRRQTAVGLRPLPSDPAKFQVAVHFRWGDVATGNTDEVTRRTRYSLSAFSRLVLRLVSLPELQGRSHVWLFSEGESEEFESFLQLPINNSSNCSLPVLSTLRLGENSSSAASNTWDDLDMMAHGDILIGGGSSFLLLAAMLAGRQQIIIADAHNDKFSDHGTGFFTPRIQRVEPFDEELFRQRVISSAAYTRVTALTEAAAVAHGSDNVLNANNCKPLSRTEQETVSGKVA